MPFAPGIRDNRAEYAYQGRAAFGEGIASGINQFGNAFAMQQDEAAQLKEENEGLMAAWESLGAKSPEEEAAWQKGGLGARQKLYSQAAASLALEEKKRAAQDNMDYNLATQQASSEAALQNRQAEAEAERQRVADQERAVLDFQRQDALREGLITPGDNERIRAAPTPQAGAKLLEDIIAATGPVVEPPSYQAIPVEGAGTMVIDQRTGKPVPASNVIRTPRPAAGAMSPTGAPPIDATSAARGLPTVVTPTAPRPQTDSQGTPLPVDWFFGQ